MSKFPFLILLGLLSPLHAQMPVTLTGSMRLFNLSNPDVSGFVPDPGAPPGFLEAYGFVGTPPPASYPSTPPGYNAVGGTTARLTFRGSAQTLISRQTIFYATTAPPFQPATGNPLVLERTLAGQWAIFDGDHLAPAGTLRGVFTLTISTLPGPVTSSGEASGSLTVTTATGTLSGSGVLGAVHDLEFEPATFPNWADNFSGPPGDTGGDVMYLAVAPVERLAPPLAFALPPGTTDLSVVDITGDGFPEIVGLQDSTSVLTILQNDGSGIFLPAGNVPVGASPVAVRGGLIDVNLVPDLVVATATPPQLEVHINAGGGVFAPPLVLPLPSPPGDLQLADLNGDQLVDLFCAMPGSGFQPGLIRAFINDGAGNFPFFVDITNGLSRPLRLYVENNGGPGQPDLFVSDGGTVFDPSSAGVRYFDLAGGMATLIGTVPTGPEPRGLLVTDLDLDDGRDIVVACLGDVFSGVPGAVKVFKGTGVGTFAPELVALANVAAVDVTVDDYDRDGRLDALVAALDRYEGTLLERWTGSSFQGIRGIPIVDPAMRAVLADVDGTGFPDLVALSPSAAAATVSLTVPESQGETYGTGCAGTFGIVPRIAMGRFPNLGNTTYSVQIRDALPGTVALLIMSFRGAESMFPGGSPPGCSILIVGTPPHVIPGTGSGAWVKTTDANGFAEVALAIPPAPAFNYIQGLVLYGQWGVLDPMGSIPTTPPLALSDGLRITVY